MLSSCLFREIRISSHYRVVQIPVVGHVHRVRGTIEWSELQSHELHLSGRENALKFEVALRCNQQPIIFLSGGKETIEVEVDLDLLHLEKSLLQIRF